MWCGTDAEVLYLFDCVAPTADVQDWLWQFGHLEFDSVTPDATCSESIETREAMYSKRLDESSKRVSSVRSRCQRIRIAARWHGAVARYVAQPRYPIQLQLMKSYCNPRTGDTCSKMNTKQGDPPSVLWTDTFVNNLSDDDQSTTTRDIDNYDDGMSIDMPTGLKLRILF